MKTLISVILLFIGIDSANAFDGETLKLSCQASDGSTFLMDQFQNDPCRIQRWSAGHSELITNVSLCIFPNEVHDEFSFWWMVPNQAKVELQGELNGTGSSYQGSLSYTSANSKSGLVSLDCKATLYHLKNQ